MIIVVALIQAMYIRVKREKTTYFIQCDPTEKTSDIKQKLQALTDQPTDKQRLTLVSSNEILVDSKTLAEQKVTKETLISADLVKCTDYIVFLSVQVENDAVVALTFRKGFLRTFSSTSHQFH